MVFVISIFKLLAESRRNKHNSAWPNHLPTLMGSLIAQDSLQSSLFHATCAITEHQHKTFDSPACFDEISSLIGKILSLES